MQRFVIPNRIRTDSEVASCGGWQTSGEARTVVTDETKLKKILEDNCIVGDADKICWLLREECLKEKKRADLWHDECQKERKESNRLRLIARRLQEKVSKFC
jgi:hypothetical protein